MIQVNNLTKKYGEHTAIENISFTAKIGHIYGLLGPNGAGKSTTMNIITGCLSSTEGDVLINGFDIFQSPEKAKKYIGYLPEHPPLYPDMTVIEYLTFVAKAKGIPPSDVSSCVNDVIKSVKCSDVSSRLIRNLSKGYKQRIGIAQALLGDPEIIILDEPMVGLDPLQITEMRELILSLKKSHTIILSSHILSEISAICDRIMIISQGKLRIADTPKNLEAFFAQTFAMEMTVKASENEVRRALSHIGTITEISYTPNEDKTANVTIHTDSEKDISEKVFFAFADICRPILRLNAIQTTLEDVFLDVTSSSPNILSKSAKITDSEEALKGDESNI